MADDTTTTAEDGIIFLGDAPPRTPGQVTEHFAFGWPGFFKKKPEDLSREIERLMAQMMSFVTAASKPESEGFRLEEIECSLALSAEGQFYFVAKAGVSGGIRLTWKRQG